MGTSCYEGRIYGQNPQVSLRSTCGSWGRCVCSLYHGFMRFQTVTAPLPPHLEHCPLITVPVYMPPPLQAPHSPGMGTNARTSAKIAAAAMIMSALFSLCLNFLMSSYLDSHCITKMNKMITITAIENSIVRILWVRENAHRTTKREHHHPIKDSRQCGKTRKGVSIRRLHPVSSQEPHHTQHNPTPRNNYGT